MMSNAKISLSELGFELDKPQMDAMIAGQNDPEEAKEVEVDETELERLLAGGLPFCRKIKDCGCKCLGVKDEEQCLPCLKEDCKESPNLPSVEDLCSICYTCEL